MLSVSSAFVSDQAYEQETDSIIDSTETVYLSHISTCPRLMKRKTFAHPHVALPVDSDTSWKDALYKMKGGSGK
jgi:hypothetical protein